MLPPVAHIRSREFFSPREIGAKRTKRMELEVGAQRENRPMGNRLIAGRFQRVESVSLRSRTDLDNPEDMSVGMVTFGTFEASQGRKNAQQVTDSDSSLELLMVRNEYLVCSSSSASVPMRSLITESLPFPTIR